MVKRLRRPHIIKPIELLRSTWNKAWTKQWLLQNTSFLVPATIVHSATWEELQAWLKGSSCPTGTWFMVKPLNLSRSRGVRLVWKEPNIEVFRDATLQTLEASELFVDLASDLPRVASDFKWLVEEYISPAPPALKVLEYDWPYNPLVRIVMSRGDFHFGELHIPTKASRGRGSIQGGARRLLFNYKGELLQKRPNIEGDHPWSITNYGTVIDVTGMVLPDIEKIVELIRIEIVPRMAPKKLFAFDGVYREAIDGSVEFVCIEIEAGPNVKQLANFNDLRKP